MRTGTERCVCGRGAKAGNLFNVFVLKSRAGLMRIYERFDIQNFPVPFWVSIFSRESQLKVSIYFVERMSAAQCSVPYYPGSSWNPRPRSWPSLPWFSATWCQNLGGAFSKLPMEPGTVLPQEADCETWEKRKESSLEDLGLGDRAVF